MTGNIVARRYAKALYSLGVKDKAAETFGKDLDGLTGMLDQSPELHKLFKNPSFNPEEKKAVLRQVAAKLNMAPMTANFLDLLADKGRLDAVADVQKVYVELLDQAQGVARGKLTTAINLSESRQASILKALEEKIQKKLVLAYEVDPAILGGAVLKVGDKVLDGSLRAQMRTLKDQIKRGE